MKILCNMEILCNFRLVLEKKVGKEILKSLRLGVLDKFIGNNFTLSDAEDNKSGLLNRGGIADLPLLRTLLAIRQISREPSVWEVINYFVLLYKFESLKNPFAKITSLSKLHFRFTRFIMFVQTKK